MINSAAFSFTGLHNMGRSKDRKNRELEDKIISLMRKMFIAKDAKTLDKIYRDLNSLVGRLQAGRLDQLGKDQLGSLISDKIHRVGDEYHLTTKLPSGLNIDLFRISMSEGYIRPEFIRAYVSTIYDALSKKMRLENEQKKMKKDSLVRKASDTMVEPIKDSTDDQTHLEELGTIEEAAEELNTADEVANLLRKKTELANRRKEAQLELEEKQDEKRSIENGADLNGLYEVEEVEVPVYREYPNPVDGDLIGYRKETRYANGSDEERSEHEETVRNIEAEIRALEEEIEVLDGMIDEVNLAITKIKAQEREMLQDGEVQRGRSL